MHTQNPSMLLLISICKAVQRSARSVNSNVQRERKIVPDFIFICSPFF